jgi:hypothetical protein
MNRARRSEASPDTFLLPTTFEPFTRIQDSGSFLRFDLDKHNDHSSPTRQENQYISNCNIY